jgi:hypothetical protein
VVVLSYRNFASGPDGSIAHAQDELDYARCIGASFAILVGQEFANVQPRKLTFYGLGRTAFRRMAERIVAAFGGNPQFQGFAVDDADAYMAATETSEAARRDLPGSLARPWGRIRRGPASSAGR